MSLMSSPNLSIVMSCYNDQECVAEAIQSIQRQTLTDWELIAINDGSNDRTLEILNTFAEADSRICVMSQPNSGLTKALIAGCAAARGKYIARQDADDRSLPERLARQVQLLDENPGVGFVSCFADYVGPGWEYLSTVTRPSHSDVATSMLLDERERLGPPAHGSVMFRKSVYTDVGGYRPEFYYAQDADLWLRMAEVSRIAYVPQADYQVQWRPVSITGSSGSAQKEFGRMARACVDARRQKQSEQPYLDRAMELSREVVEKRRKADACGRNRGDETAMTYLIGSQLIANGDPRGRVYLGRVLRKKPWHWKAWVRLAQSLVSGEKRAASGEESQP